MMPELPNEWEITTVHEVGRDLEAAELVRHAWGKIEIGYPNNARLHAKRIARAARLGRLGDHGKLVSIVAQWLTAKARTATAPDARAATVRVATLADEVEELRQHLARLSEALRFEATTVEGVGMAGSSSVAVAALSEALPALRLAQEVARQMHRCLPSGARGSAGIVGALREGPPDEALAMTLCRLWLGCGLSPSGGEDGDGLDRFVAGLLGESAAKKALVSARGRLSTENCGP